MSDNLIYYTPYNVLRLISFYISHHASILTRGRVSDSNWLGSESSKNIIMTIIIATVIDSYYVFETQLLSFQLKINLKPRYAQKLRKSR